MSNAPNRITAVIFRHDCFDLQFNSPKGGWQQKLTYYYEPAIDVPTTPHHWQLFSDEILIQIDVDYRGTPPQKRFLETHPWSSKATEVSVSKNMSDIYNSEQAMVAFSPLSRVKVHTPPTEASQLWEEGLSDYMDPTPEMDSSVTTRCTICHH